MDKNKIDELGKTQLIQKHQSNSIEDQVVKVSKAINDLKSTNEDNISELDKLIHHAESLFEVQGNDIDEVSMDDVKIEEVITELTSEEKKRIDLPRFRVLNIIEVKDDESWDSYMEAVHSYAADNHVDLTKNPFDELLTQREKLDLKMRVREDYTMKKAHCDKYDYMIASFSGIAAGTIDSFFVGMPEASKLGKWTDKKADEFVENMAQGIWKADGRSNREGKPKKIPDDLQKCISYLEQKFQVNYDARYAKDLNVEDGVLEGMRPVNHHIKSLSHSPSIIGLFFSILDQFTDNASFIDKGKIIRVDTSDGNTKLVGTTFQGKLFSGFCNWIGHLISDLVGSSSTRNIKRGKTGRGSGVGIPFYELLQFCEFGEFKVKEETINLAELSVKVFERGYDIRFGATMAIPVVLNELLIRILWAVKQRYYHEKSWKESIPFGNKPELRRMLLIGHGCLCIVDGIDAGLRSKGEIIEFSLRLNIIGWSRFAFSGLIEVRALYKENTLDLVALDQDLEKEWKALLL
ncbi:hypothetical protein [Alkalibacterium kapii]|uniref:Uncharacterized protein n=1 Tax=Alkalibacterium kapii TaxID=426704 RepID=A0A511AUH5_9LACT|nr:hypothetical protein [Alkalibacterium kapii]GEK90993.1 hypothetical protein AKA01nite_06150 [Alkalibacterium kapii]